MIRALVEQPLAAGPQRIQLTADERHHLRVRRVEPGTAVELLDGMGGVGRGVLAADGVVEVGQVVSHQPLDPVVLMVGAGDKDRFAWLVEKAVELGVTEIVPLDTERSLQVAGRLRGNHLEKLLRRADEALKQCGGAWRTVIRPPVPIRDALSSCAARERWLADPAGRRPPSDPRPPSVAIVVGPEGGLTDAERRAAEAAEFVSTALGTRTMRFETAALAAAVIARTRGLP